MRSRSVPLQLKGAGLEGPPGASEMSKRLKNRSLILLDLTLVVAILGVVAAISFPSLPPARESGDRARAETLLATIRAAEAAYCAQNGAYATFTTLSTSGFLDKRFSQNIAVVIEGIRLVGPPADGLQKYTVRATVLRTGRALEVDENGRASEPGPVVPGRQGSR